MPSRDEEYHKRPEWSYSQMKVILNSGIDYAVGARQGLTPQPASSAIDLGECVHMMILGGDAKIFALCEYADFRKKDAREWRGKQIADGKVIVTQAQFDTIAGIVKNIEGHPLSKPLLLDEGFKHEVEMYADTQAGISLRSKADALKIEPQHLTITDIKTTAMFDDFAKKAYYRHYDLQAATYTLVGSASQKMNADQTDFYFCVVETVIPHRVKYFHASSEFIDSGERKLATCVNAIAEFRGRSPNFLYPEIEELGDFSI